MRPIEIVFIALLAIWLAAVFIHMNAAIFRKLVAARGDTPINVRCDKCGEEFGVCARDFYRKWFSKSKSVKVEAEAAGFGAGAGLARSYAKRFVCPSCGKRRWAYVVGPAQLQKETIPVILKCALIHLAILVAGFYLIIKIGSLFTGE